MKFRNTLLGIALLASGTANAALIDGSVDITGAFVPIDDQNPANEVGLDVASGIDFTSDTGIVVAAAGDFATTMTPFATFTTMTDFQFDPNLDPNPVTLWTGGGFSFEMDSVVVNSQSATNLSLTGSGTVSGAGAGRSAGPGARTTGPLRGRTHRRGRPAGVSGRRDCCSAMTLA